MRKLAALVDFIIQQEWVAAENIQSFHIVDEYKPAAYPVQGVDGVICLYDQVYSAVIRIERFPVQYPPDLVFGLLACWLFEHDPHSYRYKTERSAGELIVLPNPDINTELESDSTLAIELIVPFREPVFAVRDDTGLFGYKGEKYRLADSSNPLEQFEQHYILGVDYDSSDWRHSINY